MLDLIATRTLAEIKVTFTKMERLQLLSLLNAVTGLHSFCAAVQIQFTRLDRSVSRRDGIVHMAQRGSRDSMSPTCGNTCRTDKFT